jgi:streptomycin 6-kinase
VTGPRPFWLDLPSAFLRTHAAHPAWVRALPGLLAGLAQRWSLTLGPRFADLSYNYVASATRGDGTPCVLKVGRHTEELRAEAEALRLWDGDGAARLLAADFEAGALLLERVEPGTTLAGVAARDDDAATRVAAAVLRRLWRPAPEGHALRPLQAWFGCFDRHRAALRAGAAGFPAALFARGDAVLRELLASAGAPVVLHGDLHHLNILRAGRAPWLAIDPKGLAGDPGFDVGQFLRNPTEPPPDVLVRRLEVFVAELGLDAQRTRDWCFVHSLLSACWSYEDRGGGWQRHVARAELLLGL